MAEIVSLHGDEHQQVQRLLPWYATGKLEAAEVGMVERHLQACPTCGADLAAEQDLVRYVAQQGFDADMGWRSLRQRIAPRSHRDDQTRPAAQTRRCPRTWRKWGWFLGGQAALLAAALVLVAGVVAPRAEYHTLSDRPAVPSGNVIVMFRPNLREADLRGVLTANRARIVDGPNAAGAYALSVPKAQRDVIIGRLRAGSAVVLAQPIDLGAGS